MAGWLKKKNKVALGDLFEDKVPQGSGFHKKVFEDVLCESVDELDEVQQHSLINPRSGKARGVATKIREKDGKTIVSYHGTDIVEFDDDTITLNTGGYETASTKTKMNQTAGEFDLGYAVYQRNYNWFVDYNGKTIPFEGEVVTLKRQSLKENNEELKEPEQMNEFIGLGTAATLGLGGIGVKIYQNWGKIGPALDKIFKQKNKGLEGLGDLKDIIVTPALQNATTAYTKYLKTISTQVDEKAVERYLTKGGVNLLKTTIKEKPKPEK